ncbi:MAG: peptidase inhibitor family I36 protein [Nocardioides sp.]|uniref:peptidase inhibitor family I36 protein n=1 Tax=Nocardioides sp. TaxID=35761 RepID=UPI0039E58429
MKIAIVAASLLGAAALYNPVQSSAAATSVAPNDTPGAIALDYLSEHPGGTLTAEDSVVYPDGTTFVAVPAGTLSLSQCSTGRFCMWGSTNYSGSFVYKNGDGSTLTISSNVYSLWNNRSHAARLYNNGSTASMCLAARAKKPTLAAAYHQPDKVHLSTTSSC